MEKQIKFTDQHPDIKQALQAITQNRHPITLFCDHIADPRNVGSLFRLADAARLKEIIFWNDVPIDFNKKLERISRQTINYVPYRQIQSIEEFPFSNKNHHFVSLEWTNQSIPYTQFTPVKPIVLILGNEQRGVSEELLNQSDCSVHIPMHGINTSMNVANATGIVVYDWLMKKIPLLESE